MSAPERVWEARTGQAPAERFLDYSECTGVDAALVQADLAGSIAHTLGLVEAGLVTDAQAIELVDGLQALAAQAEAGQLELDPALEDVHMNVEAQLADAVGDAADELHAGRSRNDQVALDVTLVVRSLVADLAAGVHELAGVLAEQAQANLEVPWTVQTHGQPAQPATLGFLFHAHAVRLAGDVEAALATLDELDTSPLGSAAGAGTTLPVDPSVPAEALGLDPPANAFLAAGSRDGSLAAVGLASRVGHHAQALAEDLLALAEEEGSTPPAPYTTGSSIMPHKVNPDALELARADGKRLTAKAHEVQAVLEGRGLGYDRDLQRAKGPTLEALGLAGDVLAVLADVVDGWTVDPDSVPQAWGPEIATTDAAEALVQEGVAFRQAHAILAEATQVAEDEGSIADALTQADLTPDQLEAAQKALEPDPTRRTGPGGPAPEAVADGLDSLEATLADQQTRLAEAHHAVQAPIELLEADPKALVAEALEGSA